MSFCLTNAPTTFQGVMNQLFQGLLRNFVLIFFKDILVFSSLVWQHFHYLSEILQLLQHNQLYVKLSKCQFDLTKIDYLGHTVYGNGVAMDQSKVHATLDLPLPQNLKQLRVGPNQLS